jgi:hypothetical protein
MPGVYDVYERARNMPDKLLGPSVGERNFRIARVEAIVWHFTRRGLPVPSIIPAVSPWFQRNGTSSASSWLAPIPFAEFIEEQMAPCIEAGASV